MVEISPITLVEVVIGIFLAILAVVIIPIVKHFRGQDIAHTKEITQIRADITSQREQIESVIKSVEKETKEANKAHDRLEKKIDKITDEVHRTNIDLAKIQGKK